jgi:hypothetical protein
LEAEIDEVVKKNGWFAASVEDAEPPFLYTIGLMATYDHPELIIFGLQPRTAHSVLEDIVGQIGRGTSFAEEATYPGIIAGEFPVGVRRVHLSQHPVYLGYAMGYCRYIGRAGQLSAVQIFWPDDNGKLPWDANSDAEIAARQPHLDVPLTQTERKEFERRFGYEL